MHLRFKRTEMVNADADRLWRILTSYETYPDSNPLVTSVRVLHRDATGADVEANRKVLIGPHVRFHDTYAPPPLRQFERDYPSNRGMHSVWTVEPAAGGRAYFTIVADADLPPVVGWLMRPLLARMFFNLNFPTFIRAAEAQEPQRTPDHPVSL